MSKEKAIKYIKAAQTAIDEAPYPCTTKAKILLVEALKELEDQYDTKADMEGRNQDFNN